MGAQLVLPVPKEYNVTIDLKRAVSNTSFEVVEGDTANYVNVTLTDDGSAVNLTEKRVIAVFTHSKGSYTQDSHSPNGGISITDNVIRIHMKTDSFAAGPVECELRICGDSGRSTTPVFNFECRKSLLSDSSVAAQNNLDMLTGLISQTNSALAAAQACLNDYSAIPFIGITYCNTNPLATQNPQFTATPSKYMGIFCSTDGTRPTQASDYTWVNIEEKPEISTAQINGNGELELVMSDNSVVSVQNFGSSLSSKVNAAAATIPRVSSAAMNSNGDIVLTMTDSSTVSVSGSSTVLNQKVSTAVASERAVRSSNVTVPVSAFEADNTFAGFPYKASVPCIGMQASYLGSVVFSPSDADSGNFAPVAVAGNNCVYIFSRYVPATDITVLLVKGDV